MSSLNKKSLVDPESKIIRHSIQNQLSLSTRWHVRGNDKELKCDFCGFSSRFQHKLLSHNRSAHGDKLDQLECKECENLLFPSFGMLQEHITREHTEPVIKKYSCPHCFTFTSDHKDSYKRHLTNIHGHGHGISSSVHSEQHPLTISKNLTCPLCPTFSSVHKDSLKRHLENVHRIRITTTTTTSQNKNSDRSKKVDILGCKDCPNLFFSSISELQLHKEIEHGDSDGQIKDFSCTYCSTFSSNHKHSWKRHLKKVHGISVQEENEIRTEELNRNSNYSSTSMSKNSKVDSGTVKIFYCPFCSGFSSASDERFVEHLKRDHGLTKEEPGRKAKNPPEMKSEDPSSCSRSLLKMEKKEDDEKVIKIFFCPQCSKFSSERKYSLVRHLRRAHDIKSEEPIKGIKGDEQRVKSEEVSDSGDAICRPKKFSCPHCSTFKSDLRYSLNRHLRRTHGIGIMTQEQKQIKQENAAIIKKYSCPHCSKFSTDKKFNLNRHLRRSHGINVRNLHDDESDDDGDSVGE